MQRARPVVAYDDLPHDRSAVQRAATQTDAPVREKRRKRNAHVRTHTTYHGPHWDEAPDEKVRDVPAWEEDSEDAMVASPVPGDASPFLDTVELPSGEALCSEEVWDDRFLRDAWDAAEAEYVAFHQQRTAEIDGVLAGKDAAWFRLPKESAAHAEPRAPRVDTPGWAAAQRIGTPLCPQATHSLPRPCCRTATRYKI
ncbi:hypothetical protein MVES_001027 [Malassezia vespertilionis]|uniref:Uncharacterized protein n=1 Tax=Malassezia vespertilionis TaxID=2020962 RepID=A0A2N1JF61_9BASI|nr:hypothetical protein MVES_001027 [Malassezia vespertilionis]